MIISRNNDERRLEIVRPGAVKIFRMADTLDNEGHVWRFD